jgi:hypothetical protein
MEAKKAPQDADQSQDKPKVKSSEKNADDQVAKDESKDGE